MRGKSPQPSPPPLLYFVCDKIKKRERESNLRRWSGVAGEFARRRYRVAGDIAVFVLVFAVKWRGEGYQVDDVGGWGFALGC